MSKERLEEIINDITFVAKSYNGIEPLIEYAKEQTRRVEELEMKYENIGAIFSRQSMRDRIQVLEQQNKRYREALESIANIDGYFVDKPFDMARALNLIDGEARRALDGESDE